MIERFSSSSTTKPPAISGIALVSSNLETGELASLQDSISVSEIATSNSADGTHSDRSKRGGAILATDMMDVMLEHRRIAE